MQLRISLFAIVRDSFEQLYFLLSYVLWNCEFMFRQTPCNSQVVIKKLMEQKAVNVFWTLALKWAQFLSIQHSWISQNIKLTWSILSKNVPNFSYCKYRSICTVLRVICTLRKIWRAPWKNLGRLYRVDFTGHLTKFSQGAD